MKNKNAANYLIKKAPVELMNTKRPSTRGAFPLEKMKVGEMFEATVNDKNSIYNAIKHRRDYTKEFRGRIFTIKNMGDNKIAVVRLK